MPTEKSPHDGPFHAPGASDAHASQGDVAEIVSHIADDVRSNLDPAAANLERLRHRLSSDPGGLDMLEQVEAGLLAVDAMLHLNCTPGRRPQLERISLSKLLDEVYAALANQLSRHHTTIATDVPANLTILADRPMLRAALINLTINALDAMPDGGNLVVTSFVGARGLELEFADSGPAPAGELRQRAFEPFFDKRRGGTGLALAVVYRVAELHGGTVVVRNCPEGGAAFTLCLPQQERLAAA
jgi:two-component system sensor histidine kinase HydH